MTTLIFLRHGQSLANLEKRFAGQYDTPLTPIGIEQAERAGKYIAENYRIDAIVSSDLKRAYDTALPAARRLGLPIRKMTGLREIKVGKWENLPYDEVERKYPDDFYRWRTDAGNAGCTGGETVRELSARILPVVFDLAREYEGKTLLVATHATPIRVLQCRLQYDNDFSKIKDIPGVTNASLTVVTCENGVFRIEAVGIDRYLTGLVTALPDSKKA